MAMKPCTECGKEVSTGAAVCPHCGKKHPTTSTAQKIIGGVIGLVVFLAICGRIAGGGSGASAPDARQASSTAAAVRTPMIEVDARRLWQEYDANEVNADNRYKGRILKVSGTVASIDKDFMDNIVVRLVAPNEFMSTMATMQKSEASQAAVLSKGNRVVLICEGKGRVVGSPSLDDCTFSR